MRAKCSFLLLLFGFVINMPYVKASISDAESIKPPLAKRIHTEKTINGKTLADEYSWLRDKQNPEVVTYLNAENAYTEAIMASTKALQEKLYNEMLSHVKQTDVDVPYKDGDYYYYNRTEQGKQYKIYCRKKGSTDAKEEIILDLNELAVGQKFMELGAFEVSEDGNLIAYATDNSGYRQYRLHVKDLRSGVTLKDAAENTGSIVWANDNQTMFYTVEDEAKRQYRVYKHKLGSDSKADELVYEEKDERFEVSVQKTRNRKFLLLGSGSHTTTEFRYLNADNANAQWQLMLPRVQDIEYYPDQRGDSFYIRINDSGRNFRLVSTPINSFAKSDWHDVIPERKDTMLEDVDLFENFYVASERYDGLQRLRVVRYDSGSSKTIAVPEPTFSISSSVNMEFASSKFRYHYDSLVTPSSIYDYDVNSDRSTLLKKLEIPGGYDQSLYQSERVFAIAKDGTRIPISVVYRKNMKSAGKNPLYITAYGSYGSSTRANFDSNRLSLLDRGFVVALLHIRGGGEMGKVWHDNGRMMNKMNTFTDFIAATEFLLDGKYGARDKVAIEGRSAGGLLMGAVVNLRPDLFRVVVAGMPFVDVMNTMLDTSLPLTVGEFEEWGNPQEKKAFDYMLTYSPYDNVASKSYPAMLVKTSFNDSQVGYWEPAKYVAKLRNMKTDNHVLLLQANMAAGHGGASGRYDHLHEKAFDYAFILSQLGIE